jgi:hypothetical protein
VDQDRPRRLRTGEVEVDGLLNLHEFEEQTGIELPEGPYETAAGFVLAGLGEVPQVGNSVEVDGQRITVTEMDGRRIARLRIAPAARPEPPEPAPTATQAPFGQPAPTAPPAPSAQAAPPASQDPSAAPPALAPQAPPIPGTPAAPPTPDTPPDSAAPPDSPAPEPSPPNGQSNGQAPAPQRSTSGGRG